MITFKEIELSDKDEIESYLAQNNYRACDFNFTNLWAWKVQYKAVYAVVNKTLFLRLVDSHGNPCHLIPMGEMPLTESIQYIRKDATDLGVKLQMKKLTREMRDEIHAVFPGVFNCEADPKNNEYIYTSEKLIKLSGKKLQSKRNHVNRFKKDNPDWEYFTVETNEHIALCKAMLDEWNEKYAETSGPGIEFDYIATTKMLDHFHELGLKGGGILLDGKLIAFSLGSRLTADTFDVHVEKAFGEINGAYTIINQQFVEHEASEYEYINREEDMGIENLRKAKMSYYPDILLEEGVLTLKSEDGYDKTCN